MQSAGYKERMKAALEIEENFSMYNFELFAGLSRKDIAHVVTAGVIRVVDNGKSLFRKGEIGKEVFLVLRGKIQLVDEYDTHRKVLAELGSGEFFGEMSMIERAHTHSVHAIVKEPAHLLVLTNHMLNKVIDEKMPKRFLKNIIGVLYNRIYANKNMYMRARYNNQSSRDVNWQG
jgi:CRP-like cAMP-binding protein